MTPDPDELLTVARCVEELKGAVTASVLRHAVAQGKLVAYRITAHLIRVRRRDLYDWLTSCRTGPGSMVEACHPCG